MPLTDEELILRTAVKVMTDRFDQFIGACMDAQGKPKAPSMKDLMNARGYLPPWCPHTLQKKPKKENGAEAPSS